MVSIKQFFDIDGSTTVRVDKIISVESDHSSPSMIPLRLHHDIEANTLYVSLFISAGSAFPESDLLQYLLNNTHILTRPENIVNVILPNTRLSHFPNRTRFRIVNNPLVDIFVDSFDGKENNLSETPFSGRIYIYTEREFNITEEQLTVFQQQRLSPRVRNMEYAKARVEKLTYRAFISHDSRDKDDIARPLALALQNMLCPVWYDEFSLSVGDSLRESIEKGLKDTEFCILILTPHFLSKGGWTKREYDSVYTKELIEERKVILPVWHGVEPKDVYEYSPILADRLGLNFNSGIENVSKKLFNRITRDDT